MLSDGHNFDCVIPQVVHSRQHALSKFFVGVHSLLNSCHSDVHLVNLQSFYSSLYLLVFPFVLLRRVPEDCIKDLSFFVLDIISTPDRNAVMRLALLSNNVRLELGVVRDSRLAVLSVRDSDFPVSELVALQRVRLSVPLVKIANQVNFFSARSPLAVRYVPLVRDYAVGEPA